MEEAPNNKGKQPQRIAERIVLLREYLNANASKTRAVSMKNMQIYRPKAVLTLRRGRKTE